MCNIKITSRDKHDKCVHANYQNGKNTLKQQAVIALVPWWLVLEHTIAED